MRSAPFLILCLLTSFAFQAQNSTIDSLRAVLAKETHDSARITLYGEFAYAIRKKHMDSSLVYFHKALSLAKKTKNGAKIFLGYSRLGKYHGAYSRLNDSSFFYCWLALKAAREMKHEAYMAEIFYELEYRFWTFSHDHVQSELYHDSCVMLTKKLGLNDLAMHANIFRSGIAMTDCIHHKADSKAGIAFLNEALAQNRWTKNPIGEMLINSTISDIWIGKNIDSAIHYKKLALSKARAIRHIFWLPYLYGQTGVLVAHKKDFAVAIALADSGLVFARKNNLTKELTDNLGALYNINKLKGDHASALKYLEQYTNFNDSLSEIASKDEKGMYEQILAAERQKQKELAMQKDEEIREAKAKQQLYFTLFSLGGLFLCIVFAIFLFQRYKVTREQKKIIEEKNKDIMDSIQYAKRIQTALLPSDKYIAKYTGKK